MTKRGKDFVEVDRRPIEVRVRDALLRDVGPAVSRTPTLDLSILQGRSREWGEGFLAGIAVANLARGTRDMVAPDEEPTAPYPVVDPTLGE